MGEGYLYTGIIGIKWSIGVIWGCIGFRVSPNPGYLERGYVGP